MQKISLAKIDFHLFRFINNFAKKSRMLDFFGIFFAAYMAWLLPALLVAIAYVNRNWAMAFVPLCAGAVSLALNEAVYLFYRRKRPMEITSDNMLIGKPWSPAFPSSHTSFFFALSFTLFLFNFPLGVIFLILAFFIAWGRIFCGVHWPSDIVGGVVSAGASFLIINLILTYL